MTTPISNRQRALAFVILIFAVTSVSAQQSGIAPPEQPQSVMEEVIVTGVAGNRGISKFETSYAISTMGPEDIGKMSPSGLAELMAQTPGIFVEASGGVLGNNVYTRGLPQDNFRYIRALEDGLPTFEEGAGAFTNADVFSRVDETIERVEIVRGGSAAITASNAPGSTINTITRKGTANQEGRIKLTTSDYGLYRADFNVSGPITDSVLYHVGGYQLTEQGIRDPGFTGNKGGQTRAGLNFLLDDGELYLGVKSIDDKNVFFTAMPMASASQSLPGLDATTGSLLSADFGSVVVFDGAGNRNKAIKFSAGVQTNTDTFTLLFDKEIGDGWAISNKTRRITGEVIYASVFSGSNKFDDLTDELAEVQAAAPATTDLMFRYTNGDGALFMRDQLPNNLLLDQGFWETTVDLDNLINDFQVTKSIDFANGGGNDVTVGFYYSQFDQRQQWNWQQAVTEAIDQPRLVDIVGVDGGGAETVSYTDNGIWNHHSNLQDFNDDVTHTALYITDTWTINESWRIDAGLRWHEVDKSGAVAGTTTVDLGDPSTIADDTVAVFNGTSTPYAYKDNELAWTVGANFTLNEELAFFGRYSEAFRFTPEFAQWFSCCNPTESDIELIEFGAKYDGENLSAFLTLFANEFPNVAFSTQVQDSQGNITTENVFASTEALGLEWELNLRVWDNIDLNFSGFYQSIEYKNFDFREFDPGGNPVDLSFSGNQIVRQPETVMTLRPTWYFGANENYVYGAIMHTGKRYADAANTVELPTYTTLDAGFVWNVSDTVQLQLAGLNLTDEIGITEGNPRAGTVVADVSDYFVGRSIFGRAFKLSVAMDF